MLLLRVKLTVKCYIEHVMSVLGERWRKAQRRLPGQRQPKKKEMERRFLAPLGSDEREGLRGLYPSMIHRLFSHAPQLVWA